VERLDLSDSRTFARGFPHPYFTWLREYAPIFWHEPTAVTPDGEGFWVVTRYDDVLAVQTNPEVFSSDRGGGRTGGGTAINDSATAGRALNTTDNPKHQMLRGVVMKGFTLQAVNALEAEIRRRVDRLIDDFPDGEPFDFVAAFAREVPLQAICMVLGVPQEDRTQLCAWVDEGLSTYSSEIVAPQFARRIADYGMTLIAEKRARPKDDILSAIVQARPDEAGGRPLSNEELRSFFTLLFAAGAETTRSAIAGGLKALIEMPEQMAALQRGDATLLRTAVEEFVRWTTPSIYKRRTATRDTELAGQRIRTGDKVTFWEMSANRDERAFERPFEFDISRSPNPHLGFGYGVHVCLGSMLARLEMRVGFQALLARVDDFALAGEEDWMPSNRLLGIRKLPITVRTKDPKS
jgi:cytochrome P450